LEVFLDQINSERDRKPVCLTGVLEGPRTPRIKLQFTKWVLQRPTSHSYHGFCCTECFRWTMPYYNHYSELQSNEVMNLTSQLL